jgi:3-oxoacyl-[acyl-carrier-protein] synthase III
MRCAGIRIAGLGVELGRLQTAQEAIERQLLTEEQAQRMGQQSISVIEDRKLSPTVLAARAGSEALDLARAHGGDGELQKLYHTGIHYQGHDHVNHAAMVWNQLGAPPGRGSAVEHRAMSASMMTALEDGVDRLIAKRCIGHDGGIVLITGADRFGSGFPPWSADFLPYAQGAAALALSTQGGLFEILSIDTFIDPSPAAFWCGDEPWRTSSMAVNEPVDVKKRKKSWLKANDIEVLISSCANGLKQVAMGALSDADLSLDEIDYVAFPHYTEHMVCRVLEPFGLKPDPQLLDLAVTLGHGVFDPVVAMKSIADRIVADQAALILSEGVSGQYVGVVVRRL